eukprot:gene22205-30445_t
MIPSTCYVIVAVAFLYLHFSDKGLNFTSEPTSGDRRMLSGVSLFGAVLNVPHPSYLIASAVIVIVLVNIVENWFLLLMKMTDDTPYSEMIVLIERELMTVGFTALLFKVVFTNTNFLEYEWFFALELSDVLVPFYVFCNCSVGILLVITAMKQCFIWSRAFHLQLDEILDEYHHHNLTWWMTYFAPLSKQMNQIEFRVLNILFCDSFSINRSVHFDEYVAIVLEKFILDLIEIRPSDWVILLCILSLILVMSNWTNGASFYGSSCGADDLACTNQKAVELFTIFGGFVFLLTCSIAAIARMYEKRLLGLSGAQSDSEYADYLQLENQRNKNGQKSGTTLSDHALMASLKAGRNKTKTHSVGYYVWMYPMLVLKAVQSLFAQEDKIVPDSMENIRKVTGSSGGFDQIQHSPKKPPSETTDTTTEPNMTTTRRFSPVNDDTAKVDDDSIVYDISSGGSVSAVVHVDNTRKEQKSEDRGNQPAKRKSSVPLVDSTAHSERTANDLKLSPKKTVEDDSSAKLKKQLLQVFLFGRPDLFYEAVKALLMIISAYNAFWLINFLSISTGGWKFLTLLPGLVSVVVYTYIVKAAALAKAVYSVDSEALLEILEQTEDAKQLAHEIRDKLLQNLEPGADPVAMLYQLFQRIDDDGSNKLSRLEIEDLLMEFDLSFSQKKMRQIFHQIDRNFDDNISFEEFFIFLFPDHTGAKKIEEERIAKASNRLKMKLDRRSQSQGDLEQQITSEP